MEIFQDRGVWIRIRFVLRGWIRIRSMPDRIRNPRQEVIYTNAFASLNCEGAVKLKSPRSGFQTSKSVLCNDNRLVSQIAENLLILILTQDQLEQVTADQLEIMVATLDHLLILFIDNSRMSTK